MYACIVTHIIIQSNVRDYTYSENGQIYRYTFTYTVIIMQSPGPSDNT